MILEGNKRYVNIAGYDDPFSFSWPIFFGNKKAFNVLMYLKSFFIELHISAGNNPKLGFWHYWRY